MKLYVYEKVNNLIKFHYIAIGRHYLACAILRNVQVLESKI